MNILRRFQFATQSSGRFFSLRRGAPHLSVIGRGWNKLGLAVLLPLVSLSLLSAAASGQAAAGEGSKGLITGTVVDSGGSVVKGAQLELEPLGVTVSTDDQGAFSFPMVPAGSYTVKLSAAGFATQETKVELVAGKSLR